MKGKCNCGKKATSEWLTRDRGMAWTMKYCDNCRPARDTNYLTFMYGKKSNGYVAKST